MDDLIEAMAKAIYESSPGYCFHWGKMRESRKDPYRKMARAVLSATVPGHNWSVSEAVEKVEDAIESFGYINLPDGRKMV